MCWEDETNKYPNNKKNGNIEKERKKDTKWIYSAAV